MNLSILIPTLISRKGFLNRLLESLENQIVHNHLQDKIEILVCSDNKEMTTGAKRNYLTNKAQGKFRAFVDDDDKVADNYCVTINNIIEEKGDSINYIGFKLKYVHNGDHNYKPALHTLTTGHTEWAEDSQYYYRPINHLNPMKTSTAKKVLFPDVTIYEDRDWSNQIINLNELSPQTEHFIDDTMYIYEYWDDKNKDLTYNYITKTEVIKYV